MERKTLFKFLLVFSLVSIVSFFLGKIFQINLSELQEFVSSFGIFAPLAYAILLACGLSIPFNPMPDYLMVNLAAIILPLPSAIMATFFAHAFSLTVNYFIGRRFGWKFILRFTNEKERKNLEDLSKKITPLKVFYLRWLLPLTAIGIDAVSYAAGISKMPFRKFFIASIVPWTILNILFFVFTKYAISKSTVLFFIPGVVLILTPVLIHFLFRKRKI